MANFSSLAVKVGTDVGHRAASSTNELAALVHDRMPVILRPRDYDRWLKRGAVEELPADLLRAYPAEEMMAQEANPEVGNVRNNGPEMLTSVP